MKEKAPKFPIEKYLQVKEELYVAKRALEKDKAAWMKVRRTLTDDRAAELDLQFSTAFEEMGYTVHGMTDQQLQERLDILTSLAAQGASARQLDDYELGAYNLPLFIQELVHFTSISSLELAMSIIRITIVADANLQTQKSYIGNGGAISLEWVCIYLGGGIEEGRHVNTYEQFVRYYEIFLWIFDKDTITERNNSRYYSPLHDYLCCLYPSPAVAEWQEKVLLAMISLDVHPFAGPEIPTRAFMRVFAINPGWVTILLPFENEHTKHYVTAAQSLITAQAINNLMNAFTADNKNRKAFKAFFSQRPHWLLQHIVTTTPDMIFGLVKRNEQELLAPFLKHFKPVLLALRDEKGNNLLQYAVSVRRVVENTKQQLRDAGFS